MIESLTALLPGDRVFTGDVHLAAYESDGLTAFRVRPRAVVVPEQLVETQMELILEMAVQVENFLIFHRMEFLVFLLAAVA